LQAILHLGPFPGNRASGLGREAKALGMGVEGEAMRTKETNQGNAGCARQLYGQ